MSGRRMPLWCSVSLWLCSLWQRAVRHRICNNKCLLLTLVLDCTTRKSRSVPFKSHEAPSCPGRPGTPLPSVPSRGPSAFTRKLRQPPQPQLDERENYSTQKALRQPKTVSRANESLAWTVYLRMRIGGGASGRVPSGLAFSPLQGLYSGSSRFPRAWEAGAGRRR